MLSRDFSSTNLIATLLAFSALCLVASAVYVVNDLVDVDSDRLHPVKRHRPFASGDLRMKHSVWMVACLIVAGVSLSVFALPWTFTGAIAVYAGMSALYSFRFKKSAVLDVMILAGLYTIRILMGGFATGIPVSEWLMAFAMFLFTSLAFAKRYAELARLADEGSHRPPGRGYGVADLSLIESLGPASGYLAVLVFALYINSDGVKKLYTNVWPLWLICPLLLYWITRVWLFAKRRELTDDPVVFALTDRASRWVAAVSILLVIIASVPF